ncbi:MAG: hypothetical protein GY820_15685 [Gammaproteobacteria bacterium]|nr:hypothetical protein [Gammaproteobacteria bacterium]
MGVHHVISRSRSKPPQQRFTWELYARRKEYTPLKTHYALGREGVEQRPIKIEREGKAIGRKMGRRGGRWVDKRREWGETVRCAPAILVPYNGMGKMQGIWT